MVNYTVLLHFSNTFGFVGSQLLVRFGGYPPFFCVKMCSKATHRSVKITVIEWRETPNFRISRYDLFEDLFGNVEELLATCSIYRMHE